MRVDQPWAHNLPWLWTKTMNEKERKAIRQLLCCVRDMRNAEESLAELRGILFGDVFSLCIETLESYVNSEGKK